MAKLYFRYSAMNSGKTTALIQAAFNYEERGMNVLVVKPQVDTKGENSVTSRLGAKRTVDVLLGENDSFTHIMQDRPSLPAISCVLVDEAQFLKRNQVDELFWYAVEADIPVMAYGLRTDFQTVGFEGATRLLELAHELQELKTICRCGKKAVLNARKINGTFIFEGKQVAIDGTANIEYESLCAKCYKKYSRMTTD